MTVNEQLKFVPLDKGLVDRLSVWWEDSETKRWMGGYPPSLALELANSPPSEFRGRKVLGRSALVGLTGDEPISLVDFEMYEDLTAGIALFVSPSQRKRGWGRRTLRQIAESDHLVGVETLFAGIEPDNVASVNCFKAAGFVPRSAEPDHEGIIYFDLHLREL